MTCPVRVWFEGRSNISVLLVNMGLLAKADTSVDFCLLEIKVLDFHRKILRFGIGSLWQTTRREQRLKAWTFLSLMNL